MIMVKCMFREPLHLKGPIRKLFYSLIWRVFAGINVVCMLFFICHIFLLLHGVHIVYGTIMLFSVERYVLIWQICFHISCSSFHKSAFQNCLPLSVGSCFFFFFFCDTFFPTQILSVKKGYCMCESCCLSIYFATCVMFYCLIHSA